MLSDKNGSLRKLSKLSMCLQRCFYQNKIPSKAELFKSINPIQITGSFKKEVINHKPISKVALGTIARIEGIDRFIQQDLLLHESDFLSRVKQDNWKIRVYSNKAELEWEFHYFLADLCKLINYPPYKVEAKFIQPLITGDALFVEDDVRKPIMVIAVKSPKSETLLEQKDLGQLFDYMLELRSYRGCSRMFGIITSLKQWRFCWFRDMNDLAKSSEVPTAENEEKEEETGNRRLVVDEKMAKRRELIVSELYCYGNKDLPVLLQSMVLKCLSGHSRKVSLIDFHRVYVTLCRSRWKWSMLNQEMFQKRKNSITLVYPRGVGEGFHVLYDLEGGADGKVMIGLSKSLSLVVIKRCYKKIDYDRELKLWNVINGRPLISMESHEDRSSLVLPFVFPCKNDESGVYFDFDICDWNSSKSSWEYFHEWNEKISQYARKFNFKPFEVASQAIENMARRGYIQTDLEWRHFALMPVIGKKSQIVNMRPIMIDLVRVKKCNSSKAREEMLKALNDLKAPVLNQAPNKYYTRRN